MNAITKKARHMIGTLRREEGQATVEYTLVGVCAAGVASIFLNWINNTSLFGKFFGTAVKHLIGLLG
ncbi:MAG: hypothetical protein OXH10_02525 [bacterium]|nr:hypothetical protein [bacterium]MCY3579394.1 hypothetical protein [bacterium]MCY3652345.1 hypothetical protein [bacterium]MDE0642563.1 hypothetical protein [bacterium]